MDDKLNDFDSSLWAGATPRITLADLEKLAREQKAAAPLTTKHLCVIVGDLAKSDALIKPFAKRLPWFGGGRGPCVLPRVFAAENFHHIVARDYGVVANIADMLDHTTVSFLWIDPIQFEWFRIDTMFLSKHTVWRGAESVGEWLN